MLKKYWNRGRKQQSITIIGALVLLVLLFFLRDDYQPFLLWIRKFIFVILVIGLVLFFGLRSFRNSIGVGRRIGILALLLLFFGALYFVGWHFKMYDYMKTYNVFNHLNKIEINELPLTQNERIQPLRNIYSAISKILQRKSYSCNFFYWRIFEI